MALRTYLTGIADAIREKKGTTDPINAQDFASEIASISTGGGGENPLQLLVTGRGARGGQYLCYNFKGDNVDFLNGIDFSATTVMSYMFSDAQNITTIPQINTSNVTQVSNMFSGCSALTTIDITKLPNTNSSFAWSCYSLTKLIIRTMDTLPTYGSYMLYNTYHFTGTTNSKYNPEGLQDGRIYVPDDKVDALKAATGWSEFADIIVPLSTLVED